MTASTVHRLDGLEPDNLLAFLALLGLLRSLEMADTRENDHAKKIRARASWGKHELPLRPYLHLSRSIFQQEIAELAEKGIASMASAFTFNQDKLKLTPEQARKELNNAALESDTLGVVRAALWTALICDAATKDKTVERTPFCLLDVAQTSFLKTLSVVVSSKEGREEAIQKAVFSQWQWADETPSFRWDPIEDTRHAYRAVAPSDDKQKVERGENILAAIALPVLTVVPQQHGSAVHLRVIGGENRDGKFSFAWPIWGAPTSLTTIRALLSHEELRKTKALEYLGVEQVMVTHRIAPSRYNNFTRARPLPSQEWT